MKIGKVSESILKRSVLRQLKTKRTEMVCGAGVGDDCAIFALLNEEKQIIDDFYNRALFEASRGQIKGLTKFETKLLNKLCNKN